MATQHDKPTTVDLEETAELPMLPGVSNVIGTDDPMGATDSWPAPTASRASPAARSSARPADTARGEDATQELRLEQSLREAEIGALRSDLASVTESRGQLEQNLGNLTTNLRELEQLLNRKSEQLSMFEREVGLRDRRIAELESQHATVSGEYAATIAERDTLRADLKAAREDAAAAHATILSHDASPSASLKERQVQARRLRTLEADLAQARAHAERFRENLQTLEGRRHVFDSMLGDRESVISERAQRLSALEREIAERIRLHAAREEDLLGHIKTEKERVGKLEADGIAMRAEQEQQQADAESGAKAALARHVAL